LEEFESEQGWEEVLRTASPRNRFQKKSRLEVKRRQKGRRERRNKVRTCGVRHTIVLALDGRMMRGFRP
jgi:hypothetical protein